MQAIVTSVEGVSNWLNTGERIVRAASGGGRLIVLGCLIAIAVAAVLKKVFHS
jgi:hypothetical protein